jgi:hypothetical protein
VHLSSLANALSHAHLDDQPARVGNELETTQRAFGVRCTRAQRHSPRLSPRSAHAALACATARVDSGHGRHGGDAEADALHMLLATVIANKPEWCPQPGMLLMTAAPTATCTLSRVHHLCARLSKQHPPLVGRSSITCRITSRSFTRCTTLPDARMHDDASHSRPTRSRRTRDTRCPIACCCRYERCRDRRTQSPMYLALPSSGPDSGPGAADGHGDRTADSAHLLGKQVPHEPMS